MIGKYFLIIKKITNSDLFSIRRIIPRDRNLNWGIIKKKSNYDKSLVPSNKLNKISELEQKLNFKFEYTVNFKNLPYKIKNNRQLALEVIQLNGYNLEYLNDNFKKDTEIVSAALKQNGYALEFVKPELKKIKIVKIAINQNSYALKHALIING